MPALGTLLALKELFKARRTITGVGPHQLTPADIGFSILVNEVGGTTVRLPRISGDGSLGVSAVGEGAAFCIVAVVAPVEIDVLPGPEDTFNVGQAFPITITVNNDWCIFASNGSPTRPGDWLALCVDNGE